MDLIRKGFKTYRWSILFLVVIGIIYFYDHTIGLKSLTTAATNMKEMLLLIPPIFVIMGLLDVWIPREVLTKHMGEGSGGRGLLIAFILGTAAAGPLYVAFPIGVLLLKKGAKLSNVIFFLGVWSSTKLPVLLFEVASIGLNFTLIHVGISLPLYLLIAYLIEKTESKETMQLLIKKAETM
jgi:uncharacterized membrane protein YraQ (UPF0718 family)